VICKNGFSASGGMEICTVIEESSMLIGKTSKPKGSWKVDPTGKGASQKSGENGKV